MFGLDLQSIHEDRYSNILNGKAKPRTNQASGNFLGQPIRARRSRGLYEELLEHLDGQAATVVIQ